MSGKGNIVNEQSAIRLTELGPRFTMNLLKIEEGMCDGAVIFHRNITKTPAELVEMEKVGFLFLWIMTNDIMNFFNFLDEGRKTKT